MKLSIIAIAFLLLFTTAFAQEESVGLKNSSDRMMENEKSRLTIGGYAQMDFNQPTGGGVYHNGTLDVHRMVLLFGYKFNDRDKFISEIELEHVNEVLVEQAFLNYRNFRGLIFAED